MTDDTLFQPYTMGELHLANRVVMSPLTRNRAGAGIIISEATQISREGQGYQDMPGIYTPEQIAGWRKATDAVHANPDLVERIKRGLSLADIDPSTLYGGGAKGYTDYPAATAAAVAG